ncbi:hypothetical protein [Pasteuria penetrans]|uniref:hypothetical protein n=1 Tax=Pasteuria penetrans TaxID=86005 RepID=UPI000FBBFF4C|nr:hypothetical protein [Pasteuria penetrans]
MYGLPHQHGPVPGKLSRWYGLQLLGFHVVGGGLVLILWLGWTAREVCSFLAVLFLLVGFLRLWIREPLCVYVPGLRDLYRYERQRMGDAFPLYYQSGGWIFLFLGFLFGLQAWFRSSSSPWLREMPVGYWICIVVLVPMIGIVHHQIHQRWVRQWSVERWSGYSRDRQLFLKILTFLLVGIMLGGAISYRWLVHLQVR